MTQDARLPTSSRAFFLGLCSEAGVQLEDGVVMPVVTLPDGSKREFEAPVRVADVAQSIGSGLAKAALGGIVDGKMVDTSFVIDEDSQSRHHYGWRCSRSFRDCASLNRALVGIRC
jgi:hypothetical protein